MSSLAPGAPTTPVGDEGSPPTSAPEGVLSSRSSGPALLLTVFVIAICGLVYELLFGALSTYLLGNSVTQFSMVIGLFLTAMGIGSFLNRFITGELLRAFLMVELAVGFLGGISTLVLFFAFTAMGTYLPVLVGTSLIIGALVGLEIPLLVRILRTQASLRVTLGNVLALDYLGALVASLLFPLLLVPHLGLVRTGFLFGLLNVAVGLGALRLFRAQVRGARRLTAAGLLAAALLLAGLVSAGRTTSMLEDMLYDDAVIFAKSTPYQRLVLTRWRDDLRLFINGNIQFSSADEFRYHEALVHPAMGLVASPRHILLLGAGDGLAAREVLKYKAVEHVDLVDLDPAMTQISSTLPMLTALNKGSLTDKRVKIHNADAMKYLEGTGRRYDVVIIDLPDPNDESLGKLYTRSFYRLVAKHLTPRGVMVTQATSPFYATDAFWCIFNTISSATLSSAGGQLRALPYHASVPSFGEWGFILASLRPLSPQAVRLTVSTRYLSQAMLPSLFQFSKDVDHRPTPIHRLDDQVLIRLYEKGYQRYNR